jgi:hypothetical protein
MSTGDNPRFNAGMGSIAMYAAAPVDAPYPGIIKPWPSDNPFYPSSRGLLVSCGEREGTVSRRARTE